MRAWCRFAKANYAVPEFFAMAAQSLAGGVTAGRLASWSSQDACNTLWSLVATDSRHEELASLCLQMLARRADEGGAVDRMHRTQLQQFMLWWEVELRLPPAPWLQNNPMLREQCRERGLAHSHKTKEEMAIEIARFDGEDVDSLSSSSKGCT